MGAQDAGRVGVGPATIILGVSGVVLGDGGVNKGVGDIGSGLFFLDHESIIANARQEHKNIVSLRINGLGAKFLTP